LVARWGEEVLLQSRVDAIVVCGHSGLVLAGALSFLTRLPVFAVRKANEGQPVASCGSVSGIAPNGPVRRFAWVDDLIASGGTMRHACTEVYKERLTFSPVPSAVLLYAAWGARDKRVSLLEHHALRRWKVLCEEAGYQIGPDDCWQQYVYRSLGG
jgi:hypothetical protein